MTWIDLVFLALVFWWLLPGLLLIALALTVVLRVTYDSARWWLR